MNYGYALKSIREELKITQGVAAKKAKVSQTYLSQIENGSKKSPSKAIIAKLAKVYKIPPVLIMYRAVEESDVPKDKKALFAPLNPIINSLISEVLKQANPTKKKK